jgi:stage II sporulation protein D
LPYLSPVHDPFCEKSAYRNWSKTIPVAEWGAYLKSRGYAGDLLKTSLPDHGRQKSLELEGALINLTDIRQQFGLRSSYFSIEISGNTITFKGHGYGHGLGLCQQGAMEMARVGYSYVDILMFYFRGVVLGRQ